MQDEQNKRRSVEMLMLQFNQRDMEKRRKVRYYRRNPKLMMTKKRIVIWATNEELITEFLKNLKSYKSLPLLLYHIQGNLEMKLDQDLGLCVVVNS